MATQGLISSHCFSECQLKYFTNLLPVFMLSSAVLMSLVLSFFLCFHSAFSALPLCGVQSQTGKSYLSNQLKHHCAHSGSSKQFSPPEVTQDEHMHLKNCNQWISQSPTASPAVPACVPSRPVNGRWCPGAPRWKRAPLGWGRAGLRSGESEASQFAPVSYAPVVMGQLMGELSATLKYSDYQSTNKMKQFTHIVLSIFNWCSHPETHRWVQKDPDSDIHTPPRGTSSPPLPLPSVLSPTPPSASPVRAGTSPVTMATDTWNTAQGLNKD